jgi:nucleotide-binding universal stress UspA family protein
MKILFPTDYSNAAENAFLYALKVAEKLQASITAMHAFEGTTVMSWTEDFISTSELIDHQVVDEFEKYKSEVNLMKRLARENELDQIEVNYSLREAAENVVGAILDEAVEHDIDLIIIGTTGAKGLKELFFGSIASRVMQSAPCPVLVIPDTANYRGIEKLGLTLEYKPGEPELINKALEFTRKIGGNLECVHVDAFDPNRKKTKIAEYAGTYANVPDISFHTHYDLNVERGILDYMKTNHVDIIIMEVREEHHLKELFSYSIAKRVSYHSDIPLLAFPNGKKEPLQEKS